MTRPAWVQRADRLQRTRGFKLAASGLIVLIMLVLSIGAVVRASTPAAERLREQQASISDTQLEATELDARDSIANTDAADRMLADLLRHAESPAGFVMSVGVVGGIALTIVWLGAGLSYLAIAGISAVIIGPLAAFDATRGGATLLGGISSLALAFTVLLRLMQTLLAGRGPVSAIAANVLAEAIRLKLSLVFIVLLIFGLAALPGLLDPETPLRYRVQSFLQYGTGGTFWLIAVLVVAFSVSTVATEQRDKIIWQTVTKPVAAWQYILGKWVGVSALAALLLAVNAAGVFLFVEYLRQQPAQGEREAYVALNETGVSEDRLILESQILTARRAIDAAEPDPSLEQIDAIISSRVENIQQTQPDYQLDPATRDEWRKELYSDYRLLYFAIPPGGMQRYVFEDVGFGPDADIPVTLTYRIDAAANRPDLQFLLSFRINNAMPIVRDTGLGHAHSMPITPALVIPPLRGSPVPMTVLSDEPAFERIRDEIRVGRITGHTTLTAGQLVDESGNIVIYVYNGETGFRINERTGQISGLAVNPNSDAIRFPASSLTISFPVGSYHGNFLRAVFVLWMKLAFLAMLGVAAATFLSYSVASLVAFGVFLIAQSAPFIKDALEIYATVDRDNQVNLLKVIIAAIAHGVSWIFLTYGSLQPVEKLVSGENVSLASLARGLSVIAVWVGLLYAFAVLVFRKRELAVYSGQ
ncbi:MAG: hypothetical protein AAGB48_02890 [Planctomycetota bacterium]